MFSSAFEALSWIEENNVDVILTDVKMPRMSGLDLIEEVKKRKQKIKQAKIYSELGRMLTERFPGITPDTFDEFIASKATGNEVLPTPR